MDNNKRILISSLLFICYSVLSYTQYVKQQVNKKTGKNSECYTSVTFDGSWCWFSDPRAIYYEGKYKRLYTGWIDSYGDIHVAFYDYEKKSVSSKILFDNLEIDDHDNPALLFDKDGRLMVFFSKHASTEPIYMLKAVNPEDISEWYPIKSLAINDIETYKNLRNSYTYSCPVRLSGENNRIYLFWRGIDGKPTFSFSNDGGDTWSKGKIFIMPERQYYFARPYVKIFSNGKKRIHIAFTDGHPRNEKQNSIYYMYYENNSFYKINGEKIADIDSLPVMPHKADVVYNAKATLHKAWIWDVAEDEKGFPVIAYVKFPNDSNHIYCIAYYDGKKWNNYDLINAGKWFPKTPARETEAEPNYSGGISIDKENTNVLYLSVNRDSVFEIEKWTTLNKGKSWKIENITKGSSKDNVRPFAIYGAKDNNPLQVLWMQNTRYIHYGLGAYNKKIGFEQRYHSSLKTDKIYQTIKNPLNRDEIIDIMQKVADWQLANPHNSNRRDWLWGAFYVGLIELYKITEKETYLNEMINIGQSTGWKPLDDIFNADRLTICDVFGSLYKIKKDPAMIDKTKWAMDIHIARGTKKTDVRYKDNPYNYEWWTWCDALFMAPPSFARMYDVTGEKKYLDYMDKQWWKTTDYLYSKDDSLYYRDDNYFNKKSINGKKMFWSRGNGWVIAGIARILDIMPSDYPTRSKYEQLYNQMALKLLSIQLPDGLWPVSLLDPDELPMGESSGSAFYCYALAWGINKGLIDKKYKPQVEKAWIALTKNVNEWGRLGYVQQVADKPFPFYDYQWQVYASGAFLLAGKEMLKLEQ